MIRAGVCETDFKERYLVETRSPFVKALIAVGAAAGVIFILAGHVPSPHWARVVVKPIPALVMLLIVATLPSKGARQWAVAAGLFLSAVGDILLEISPEMFLFGLIAFLLAHISYIIAFTKDCKKCACGVAALAYGYAVAIYFVLSKFGHLGDMAGPVLAYVIIITTMVWRAGSRVGAPGVSKRSSEYGLLGAILFLLSDSLLGFSTFVSPFPASGDLVILTYWMGLIGITLSVTGSDDTLDANS